jgi:hypothetical protein
MKSTKDVSPARVSKNVQSEEFDLVILGGGTGSTVAGWTFAGEGRRAAVESPFVPNLADEVPTPVRLRLQTNLVPPLSKRFQI